MTPRRSLSIFAARRGSRLVITLMNLVGSVVFGCIMLPFYTGLSGRVKHKMQLHTTFCNFFSIVRVAMGLVTFESMEKGGKKGKFLHIRSDEELHAALQAAAQRACRRDTDQARYLLRMALGLQIDEVDLHEVKQRVKRLRSVHDSRGSKGGGSQ